jgi:hypothetical protein
VRYTVTRDIIPVDPANPFALGRHVHHDSRSRNYPAELARKAIDVFHQSVGLPLNQGQLGKCTAEGLCGRLNTQPGQPAETFRVFTDTDSDQLYGVETENEGQPWPPNDPGGSGLAVCKAAKQLGWIKSYGHTFSFGDALKGLTKRPFIVGTNWYQSMFQPGDNSLVTISPDSAVAGGHEYLCVQNITEQQLLGFWNSWGQDWGKGGMFYMTYATVERLLAEQGDVTFPYVR